MRRSVALSVAFCILSLFAAPARAQSPLYAYVVQTCGTAPAGFTYATGRAFPVIVDINGNLCTAGAQLGHASVTALGTSLLVKASAGNLYAFNCTSITGGAAGFCVAYNAIAVPSTGALTGALVLDYCFFDTTARGCSLSRIPNSILYNVGVVILVTSAATPFTYTTGTDTAAITADFN